MTYVEDRTIDKSVSQDEAVINGHAAAATEGPGDENDDDLDTSKAAGDETENPFDFEKLQIRAKLADERSQQARARLINAAKMKEAQLLEELAKIRAVLSENGVGVENYTIEQAVPLPAPRTPSPSAQAAERWASAQTQSTPKAAKPAKAEKGTKDSRSPGRMKRRSAAELEAAAKELVKAVKAAGDDGIGAGALREQLKLDKKELPMVIKVAIKAKEIRSRGSKRATLYFGK